MHRQNPMETTGTFCYVVQFSFIKVESWVDQDKPTHASTHVAYDHIVCYTFFRFFLADLSEIINVYMGSLGHDVWREILLFVNIFNCILIIHVCHRYSMYTRHYQNTAAILPCFFIHQAIPKGVSQPPDDHRCLRGYILFHCNGTNGFLV